MRKFITSILLLTLSLHCLAYTSGVWEAVNPNYVPGQGKQLIKPTRFAAYLLNTDYFHQLLFSIADRPASAQEIELPMPDGSFRSFKVWQCHIMLPLLEKEYADIRTLSGYATDNPSVTVKLDYTLKGFHAMIYDGVNTALIDPYSNGNDGYYMCYYKHDYNRPESSRQVCGVSDTIQNSTQAKSLNSAMRQVNGNMLRIYRLALACTGEYAQAVDAPTPNRAGVLSVMTTNLNRINGVYERELAVTFQLVNNEDTLIFLSPSSDYTNSNIFALMGQNEFVCDSRIGNANYDIGHVFSTGPGGVAQISCICRTSMKAEGTSGSATPTGDAFDIDYTAHEMGHQLGGIHTFNDDSHGSCAGNMDTTGSYEPGGGTTLMAYAGVCAGDDLQAHSDAYFHAASLKLIIETLNDPAVSSCPVMTISGNKPVSLPAFATSYNIPYLTAFEFSAPAATDSVADTLTTYCWEEWDRGDFGAAFNNTHKGGPIFRSFSPSTSQTRIFPCLRAVLNDSLGYLGEKAPDSARTLVFKLTVRDIYNGIGAHLIPDDSIQLNVINTHFPFTLTSPNTQVNWVDTVATISWNVSRTDLPPINCAYVDLYLSTDGGNTWPYILKSHVPNTGVTTVTVPDIVTKTARVKIKAENNVFFDISDKNFNIGIYSDDVVLYPNPTGRESNNVLYLRLDNNDSYNIAVYNTLGQRLFTDKGTRLFNINTQGWASGVYFVKLEDEQSGKHTQKSFVVR